MHDLVRDRLGFRGVTITDALDMEALPQGDAQAIDAIAALQAGNDLLLCVPDQRKAARIEAAVVHAAARRLFDPDALRASDGRLAALRARLAEAPMPDLDVVGGAEHRALARSVAERSITLVRDRAAAAAAPARTRRHDPRGHAAAADPDARGHVRLGRAGAGRRAACPLAGRAGDRHVASADNRRDRRCRRGGRGRSGHGRRDDRGVRGPAQAALVDALLAAGRRSSRWRCGRPGTRRLPAAGTHVVAYGILGPTLAALAGSLFGERPFRGRLPVALPRALDGPRHDAA